LKIPARIEPLVEAGLVDSVSRALMSGKEAMLYVVRCGEDVRCAKVYKEADRRSFRQSVDYTEGRRVKNSRRARAMEKGSRYGRKRKKRPGKAPRWTPWSVSPPPACACRSPTTSSTACC